MKNPDFDHCAMNNVVSDISKILMNDIFAELDGSSGIKNIITYRSVESFES